MIYVIARNAHGRPTLQHRLVMGSTYPTMTGCGLVIDAWSRSYSSQRIDAVFCKRSGCRS